MIIYFLKCAFFSFFEIPEIILYLLFFVDNDDYVDDNDMIDIPVFCCLTAIIYNYKMLIRYSLEHNYIDFSSVITDCIFHS